MLGDASDTTRSLQHATVREAAHSVVSGGSSILLKLTRNKTI